MTDNTPWRLNMHDDRDADRCCAHNRRQHGHSVVQACRRRLPMVAPPPLSIGMRGVIIDQRGTTGAATAQSSGSIGSEWDQRNSAKERRRAKGQQGAREE